MSANIQKFIKQCIAIGANVETKSTAIANAYKTFNGSTEGKLKMFKALEAIEGVSRAKCMFIGIKLSNECVNAPVKKEESAPSLTAYQRAKLELKQKEIEMQKELQKEGQESMKEQNMEIEKMRIDAQKEMLETKERYQKEIKQMEIDSMEKEKHLDREFIKEENNKYRVMYVSTHFNKYTDLKIYGNPTTQFISDHSARDVLAFTGYRNGVDITTEMFNTMEENIKQFAEPVAVIEDDQTKQISAINVNNIKNLIPVSESMEKPMSDFVDKVESLKQASKSDYRYQVNEVDLKVKLQDQCKYKSRKEKQKYVKARNNIKYDDGRIIINCYCCDKEIELNSSSCHRCHDIPQSKGGDWSTDNIFLCCSDCNNDMTDELTVIEYTANLFDKKIMHRLN